MAAYAAVVSLMNNIDQIMNHPRVSAYFDYHQLQHLLEKAGSLLSLMEANNYGGGNREAQDLEREIASAAHVAEDVIESHLVAQIHARTSKKSLLYLLDLQQKIQDMDAVMKRANEFKWSQVSGEEPPTPVMEIGDTALVGRDAELSKLVDELTFERPSNLYTISIVGMGGMGKTTLAKNIYENQLIKHHFDLCAWASISQQHNAQETLSQLVCDLGKSSDNELGLQLHKNLSGRRYLIILDDIWSVKAWDEVRQFFPDNSNGSRVVLTTRLSDVARNCSSSLFVMKFLDEYNSRKLFFEVAFKNEPCPPELREVSEEIVKLCKGLALSIVVMGGLFYKSPKTREYWKGIVKDIKSSVLYSKEKQKSLDVLSLSYTHLPPHLKPCFLYMGIFREDAQIRVSGVVKLWVAEGFIKPNGSQVLEEIGEGYMRDLIDRNLILVGGLRKNGKIGSCGIHDLLRDLCIKVGEQQEFFHMINEDYIIQGSERRLVCRDSNRIQGLPLVRCVMTGEYRVGQLNKKKLLRVLKFGGVSYSAAELYWDYQNKVYSAAELYRNYQNQDYSAAELFRNYQTEVDLAAELYRNVNLRYLAYNQPYDLKNSLVWELPISASLVWNLQTLIIKGIFPSAVVVASTEFWKMRQLRHVDCHRIYVPPCIRGDEMLVLENMRTLKTAVNFNLSEEACKSIPNIKKLGLLFSS